MVFSVYFSPHQSGPLPVPELHVSTVLLLQLKKNQVYHKMDSHIQTTKVRSGAFVCACACIDVCVH